MAIVANAEIGASLAGQKQFEKDFEALLGRAASTAEKKRVVIKPTIDVEKAQAEAQKVADNFNKQMSKMSATVTTNFAKANAAAEKAAQAQAAAAEKKVAAEQAVYDRIAAAAKKTRDFEVREAEKAARKMDSLHARAIGEDRARTIKQIDTLHASALKENQAFDKLRTSANTSTNVFKKFSDTMAATNVKLRQFGLSTQDLAIIMGAGLAGGIAFAIREVIQFATESVKLAGALEGLKVVSEEVFGSANKGVKEFADNALESLGISERAALQAANRFGTLFKNLGFQDEDVANLSTSLVTLATSLSRASGGTKSVEDGIRAVAGVLKAEFDPIEEFGIAFKNADLEQEAFALGIAKVGEELNKQQKAIAGYSLILKQSGTHQEVFGKLQEGLPAATDKFTASIEELKTSLGEGLLPLVQNLVDSLNLLLKPFLDQVKTAGQIIEFLKRDEEKADNFWGRVRQFATQSPLKTFAEIVQGEVTPAIDEMVDREGAIKAYFASEKDGAQASAEELKRLRDARERLADTEIDYNRALADFERDTFRAERELHRTRKDGIKKIKDAEKDLFRTRRDAARAVADAEEAVADAKLQGFRQVRDAREALEDFERDSNRDAQDGEKALRDQINQRTQSIRDATLAIEAAMRAGDAQAENQARLQRADAERENSTADLENQLAEERKEREIEHARLIRDLDEAKIDSTDRILDAQRELERTIVDSDERIADAEEKLEDAILDRDRAVKDAQENLDDAMREGQERVDDLSKAWKRMKREVNELEDAIDEVKDATKELANLARDLPDIYLQGGLVGEDIAGLSTSPFEGRMAGGPIVPGRNYWVGEDGPELISTGGSSGFVHPNGSLFAMLMELLQGGPVRGGGSLASPTFYIQVPTDDPETLARRIASRLVQSVG